ncbi:MAG: Maf family protein [Lachnospiraceae bacterium]
MFLNRKLILASASPRRREILDMCGFTFEVLPASADESSDEKNPGRLVELLSARKAEACLEDLAGQGRETEDLLILGCDTVVYAGGRILGKPADRQDAERMLADLQGRSHSVFSGVTLIWFEDSGRKSISFSEATEVEFAPMTGQEIADYASTGECDDKAGAYGIQGYGMKYVSRIRGDYHNVVGLPAAAVYKAMKEYGLICF